MFAVVITEKGGAQRRLDFDKNEVTIGRVQGNDIILPKGNVSKRHSRIVLKDNRFIVVDLKSTNGTYVNGRKITSPLVVKAGDKIYIGDFILTLEEGAASGMGDRAGSDGGPAPMPDPMPAPSAPAPQPMAPAPAPAPMPAPMPAPVAPAPAPMPAPMAPAPAPAPMPAARHSAPPPLPARPAPAPTPSPAMASPAPSPMMGGSVSSPGADNFDLDKEPSGADNGSPSPRVVSSHGGPGHVGSGNVGSGNVGSGNIGSPSSPGIPQQHSPGPATSPPPRFGAGPMEAGTFWEQLVVAAVSAGKDADAAMALADAVVRRGPRSN